MIDRDALWEAIAQRIVGLIVPQLMMLGWQPSTIPPEQSAFSKRSRGYIFGIAYTVANELPADLRRELMGEIIENAFYITYGADLGPSYSSVTMEDYLSTDGEVLAGYFRAKAEMEAVDAGSPHQAMMGFWLLNNGIGDPEEFMPAFVVPQSLSAE
jgi:hypothetical protein